MEQFGTKNSLRFQVAWWDETHHQCSLRSSECGYAEAKTVTTFPRAPDGRVDLVNGVYREIQPTNTKVKYDKEVRFALGVAMVKTIDNKIEGRRLEPFDYTNKTIIPAEDWNRKEAEEIKRVKSLEGDRFGNKNIWTEDIRHGRIFEGDVLVPGLINGIAAAKAKMLATIGINTVGDLKSLTDIKSAASRLSGIGVKSLKNGLTMRKELFLVPLPQLLITQRHRIRTRAYIGKIGKRN